MTVYNSRQSALNIDATIYIKLKLNGRKDTIRLYNNFTRGLTIE